jgi:hypothetical protein
VARLAGYRTYIEIEATDDTVHAAVSLPLETITRRIAIMRDDKILLDPDVAAPQNVPSERVDEQIKRNLDRFQGDFIFQLLEDQYAALRSQFAPLKSVQKQHRKYLPSVFTEQYEKNPVIQPQGS